MTRSRDVLRSAAARGLRRADALRSAALAFAVWPAAGALFLGGIALIGARVWRALFAASFVSPGLVALAGFSLGLLIASVASVSAWRRVAADDAPDAAAGAPRDGAPLVRQYGRLSELPPSRPFVPADWAA